LQVRGLFDIYKELQSDMCCAAADEDYVEASRIKTKRDDARSVVLGALNKAEIFVSTFLQKEDSVDRKHHLEDLSLSAITSCGIDNDIPMGMSMSGRSFPRNSSIAIDNRPILSREESLPENDYSSSNFFKDQVEKKSVPYGEDGKHPLEGVPDFINLPVPEEIRTDNETMGISLSSSEINTTSDSITRIESIIGVYCARCFLSKHWVLREAALIKTSIILPDKIKQLYPETIMVWWETFSKAIHTILKRAIDDRIVQVFLTGLILLDDCITEFEEVDVPLKNMRTFLASMVPNLIAKLGDGNFKVVEGAETALMCLAMCRSVGPSFISMQVMKLVSTKDRSRRSLCSRLKSLQSIVEEFGEEGPNGPRVMEFVKKYCFNHKDVDVRDATRKLSATLFARDGNIVLSMLEGLSDRQLKEYKVAFAGAVKTCKINGDTSKTEENRHDMKSTIQTSESAKKVPKDHFTRKEDKYLDRSNTIEYQSDHGLEIGVDENPILGSRSRSRGRGRGCGCENRHDMKSTIRTSESAKKVPKDHFPQKKDIYLDRSNNIEYQSDHGLEIGVDENPILGNRSRSRGRGRGRGRGRMNKWKEMCAG